jgi:hypothetical protein
MQVAGDRCRVFFGKRRAGLVEWGMKPLGTGSPAAVVQDCAARDWVGVTDVVFFGEKRRAREWLSGECVVQDCAAREWMAVGCPSRVAVRAAAALKLNAEARRTAEVAADLHSSEACLYSENILSGADECRFGFVFDTTDFFQHELWSGPFVMSVPGERRDSVVLTESQAGRRLPRSRSRTARQDRDALTSPPKGSECGQSPSRLTHVNRWSAFMLAGLPGSRGSLSDFTFSYAGWGNEGLNWYVIEGKR